MNVRVNLEVHGATFEALIAEMRDVLTPLLGEDWMEAGWQVDLDLHPSVITQDDRIMSWNADVVVSRRQ